MNKTIQEHYRGTSAVVGEFDIVRALPHSQAQSIGPFVFLDHFHDLFFEPRTPRLQDGSEAHPHRGIATLSYSLEGEFFHYDSLGNASVIGDGGAQWLKAGRGVVHDGGLSAAFQESGGNVNAFQFWINLTARQKAEEPDYIQVLGRDVPQLALESGSLRVVLGNYDGTSSPLPSFSDEVLFHIALQPGSSELIKTKPGLEYGAYVARGSATINGAAVDATELVAFSESGDQIHLTNTTPEVIHIMVFGGLPYQEPIVFGGPFVMNTPAEIDEATHDYQQGRYGNVVYPHELVTSPAPTVRNGN